MSLHKVRLSVVRVAAVLAGATLSVAAQGTVTNPQDKSTGKSIEAVNPFSPFVYDVLGATPSLRLRIAKPAAVSAPSANDSAVAQSSTHQHRASSLGATTQQAPAPLVVSEPSVADGAPR